MATKHIFTDGNIVLPALRALAYANPHILLHSPSKTLFLASPSPNCVPLICGGGSGHEPFAAGYVAPGLLTAAVSGDIFASPSTAQIGDAISLVPNERGVVIIHNNYTGDCLHFGVAAEKARAQGISVEFVVVADDVAVPRTRGGLVGRRGLGGIILTCKILGGASARGLSLASLAALGRAIVSHSATIGTSLEHCHIPGTSIDNFEALPEGTSELGMGMHNEPGLRKVDGLDAKGMVGEMLKLVMEEDEKERGWVKWAKEDKQMVEESGPVLLVNNLGGLSVLELSAVAHEVITQLASTYSLHPTRIYAGTFLTSLNSPGFSITLLNATAAQRSLSSDPSIPSILALLDDPTDCPAWGGASHWPSATSPSVSREVDLPASALEKEEAGDPGPANEDPKQVEQAIRKACERVISAEPELTKWDTEVGDGDCGTTFKTAAEVVLSALGTPSLPTTHSSATISSLVRVLEPSMGGTSGALFSLYLTALSAAVRTSPWPEAASTALSALQKYTPARQGDRTLVDALEPFCATLSSGGTISAAAKAAQDGAERTRGMRPRLGRATYVGGGEGGGMPPDPGAWGVAALLTGLAEGLTRREAAGEH